MTHPGDGDVSDEGRRKRRRRRRGRRGKNAAAVSSAKQSVDAPGTRSNDAAASQVNSGPPAGGSAENKTAASGKRKSRSRRRKSGMRGNGAADKPSSGTVPSAAAQSDTTQSGSMSSGNGPAGTAQSRSGPSRPRPSRNAKSKRAGNERPSVTLLPADAIRGTDEPAVVAPSTPASATRTDAPDGLPGDADALAARRARADRETSAGGIVYRVQNGEALFLIIRDSYRNWGFPKGHLEGEELPDEAAIREVQEETGLVELKLDGAIETIDWFFRFRGRLVHKVCHFYLMRTENWRTVPQREEGITACRWARYEEATRLISYANARSVLSRANAMVLAGSGNHADADAQATSRAHAGAQTNTSTKAADAARG